MCKNDLKWALALIKAGVPHKLAHTLIDDNSTLTVEKFWTCQKTTIPALITSKGGYRISSIKRTGVYFLMEFFDPALNRGRRLIVLAS